MWGQCKDDWGATEMRERDLRDLITSMRVREMLRARDREVKKKDPGTENQEKYRNEAVAEKMNRNTHKEGDSQRTSIFIRKTIAMHFRRHRRAEQRGEERNTTQTRHQKSDSTKPSFLV